MTLRRQVAGIERRHAGMPTPGCAGTARASDSIQRSRCSDRSAPLDDAATSDRRVAIDDVGLAGADAEHDDAEEIAEIVPAAVVGHGVDRDLVGMNKRDQPGDREDEAVPQAEQKPGVLGVRDRVGALRRGAGGERERRGEGEEGAGAVHGVPSSRCSTRAREPGLRRHHAENAAARQPQDRQDRADGPTAASDCRS